MTKVLELNFVTEDSPSFHILKSLGGKVEAVDTAPYIDLPHSWEDYLGSLDRHDRHELRRKMRKLEEEETLRVCHTENVADIDEFLRLMQLSKDQKKEFLSDKMKFFFRDVFSTFFPKKNIQLCFLKLNGINIAATFSFISHNQVLLYNSGLDPEYYRLSAGLILTAFDIKQAIEEGVKRFDFLRGGERYKFDLGGKERKLYKILL
jgi:CelD/BcsL family acetyltransferase involved in cellulose biosynthesis